MGHSRWVYQFNKIGRLTLTCVQKNVYSWLQLQSNAVIFFWHHCTRTHPHPQWLHIHVANIVKPFWEISLKLFSQSQSGCGSSASAEMKGEIGVKSVWNLPRTESRGGKVELAHLTARLSGQVWARDSKKWSIISNGNLELASMANSKSVSDEFPIR